jgi:septal ring factor EnvC (AmiA/AmiB activator)
MRSVIMLVVSACVLVVPAGAFAQDVPGIENCMAEKQIERRTGCLQSNINFLKTQITAEVGKAKAEAQARLDDAAKQIDALKLLVASLQAQLKQVQADLAEVKAKASPNPASK